MLRELQGPGESNLPTDLYIKPEDKMTLALLKMFLNWSTD